MESGTLSVGMTEIDIDAFREIQQFHRDNYEASPRFDTLFENVQQAYPILNQVATDRELITYGELREKLGTHRGYLAPILGTISHLEMRNDRPPLSVIVVRSDSNRPGTDFMNLFCELDAQHPYPNLSAEDAIEQILEDVYTYHADSSNIDE